MSPVAMCVQQSQVAGVSLSTTSWPSHRRAGELQTIAISHVDRRGDGGEKGVSLVRVFGFAHATFTRIGAGAAGSQPFPCRTERPAAAFCRRCVDW